METLKELKELASTAEKNEKLILAKIKSMVPKIKEELIGTNILAQEDGVDIYFFFDIKEVSIDTVYLKIKADICYQMSNDGNLRNCSPEFIYLYFKNLEIRLINDTEYQTINNLIAEYKTIERDSSVIFEEMKIIK